MKPIIVFLFITSVILFVGGQSMTQEFLKAELNKLIINGREYRAIGMNKPDLFTSYSAPELFGESSENEELKQKTISAIIDAEMNNIAFFRFWATGFWPRDMQIYFENPDVYWKKMDEVFNLCREHKIKLIPSIFWNIDMWPMICEEDRQAILDPNSKTYKSMHRYAHEIVSRYKDDSNVLMWEITNEGFLNADVQMEGREAPSEWVYLPNNRMRKKVWKKEDSLTAQMLRKFYLEMAKYIKGIDPNHLITSGDANVRETSQSLRESFPEQVWIVDSLRQNMSNLLDSQPEPLDVFSFHQYGSFKETCKVGNLAYIDYFRCMIRTGHASLVPVFIGELGQFDPSFKDDLDSKWTCTAIDMMEEEEVSLICIWVWHFPHQPENDIRSSSHPILVNRIKDFNDKFSVTR